ncbi:hypothetical protein LEP1GSC059_0243 [Leptospira noguchii serovar Panama str. CZ214]|uniref:Uncharacterized protein n=1 Tax=Leptospira noguchii serovar Panama str. CZ214 TaxID=1001595 RepID=T0FVE2_9LEPT|nr:hypothetical protein LEP1GSC059_0243 [Leptospira noguchii serovar Panama str. CZ214]
MGTLTFVKNFPNFFYIKPAFKEDSIELLKNESPSTSVL